MQEKAIKMNMTSIMFVTYNRLELTTRMLNSLFKNTNSPFRLIIVDNGSTDNTKEYLKKISKSFSDLSEYCVGVDLKFNETNKGIAIGRNQCLKLAEKFDDEWLSTMDNDVEVPFGWLTECVEVLKSNKQYGMIGVNMEDVKYPLVTFNGKTFQRKLSGNLGTACTVFNKNLHSKLGYFNSEYGCYGEEDSDFGIRVRASKLELGYISAMGHHFGQGELDQGEYREFKDVCRSKNLNKFRENCFLYMSGRKSCFVPFKDE